MRGSVSEAIAAGPGASKTFYSVLCDHARDFPRQPAIRFAGRTLTYGFLKRQVDLAGGALERLGLRRGARLALMLPNIPQFVIAYLAAIKLGAVVVPIGPPSAPREISAQLADSGAEFLVALDLFLDRVREAGASAMLKGIVVTGATDCLTLPSRLLAGLRRHPAPSLPEGPAAVTWRRFLKASGGQAPEIPHDMDDPAWLGYTGGVNGRMKAAVLTHRNLAVNAVQIMSLVPGVKAGEEVVLSALPFWHGFGLTACLNAPLMARSLMVLLPRFEAKAAVREIEKRRVTALVGVPAMFGAICDCPGATRAAFRSVRGAFSGGATLSPELQSRFRALTGRPLANCYGLTEAAPAVTGEPPSRVAEKPGSIGLPLPGTVISVLDRETLTPLPVGQMGELAIKGPQVMSGYWNAPDETAEVIKDGWLLTGDLARLDTDGFAYLVGLSKRMINVSGFKVYPQEVEAVLCAHPRIRAAVVTGVADGCRGEAVMASIALVDGAALTRHEVLRYCRAQLASYKAPKIVEIVRGSGTAPKESGP